MGYLVDSQLLAFMLLLLSSDDDFHDENGLLDDDPPAEYIENSARPFVAVGRSTPQRMPHSTARPERQPHERLCPCLVGAAEGRAVALVGYADGVGVGLRVHLLSG